MVNFGTVSIVMCFLVRVQLYFICILQRALAAAAAAFAAAATWKISGYDFAKVFLCIVARNLSNMGQLFSIFHAVFEFRLFLL